MFHNALLVQRSEAENGVYKISQVENSTPCGYKSKDRMPFKLDEGLFSLSGSLHTASQEMEVSLEVYKMNLGIFHGDAIHGLKIDLDLNVVKGSIELRLTGFDELWVYIDTKLFQVADHGSGKFIEYKQAHRVQEVPGLRCAPWTSAGSGLEQ